VAPPVVEGVVGTDAADRLAIPRLEPVLPGVPGVIAVDVDALGRSDPEAATVGGRAVPGASREENVVGLRDAVEVPILLDVVRLPHLEPGVRVRVFVVRVAD